MWSNSDKPELLKGRQMTTATYFTADIIKRSDAFADFAIEEKVQDWSSIISNLNLVFRIQDLIQMPHLFIEY